MGKRTPVNAEVIVTNQDSVGRAIKKFIRKVKKSGILDEVRDRRYYEKKADKKRRKKSNARRKQQLENEKRKKREAETNYR